MSEAHLDPRRIKATTASQANIVVNGSKQELLQLWRERIGEVEPEDLSDVLAVQLGKHNEPFILDWLQRTSGIAITERQAFVQHATLPLAATLDGVRDGAVIEAKMVNPFGERAEAVAYYTPQVLVQMRCRGLDRGILAMLRGFAIEEIDVHFDDAYEREVIARLLAFQHCVDTMTPPVPLPKLVPPEQWRTVDLATVTPVPNWAMPMKQSLRLWSDTREAAQLHDQSKRDVKDLLPDDVGTVLHGTMSVRRAKNNAITIRERGTS